MSGKLEQLKQQQKGLEGESFPDVACIPSAFITHAAPVRAASCGVIETGTSPAIPLLSHFPTSSLPLHHLPLPSILIPRTAF